MTSTLASVTADTGAGPAVNQARILVAMASYGDRNRHFRDKLIAQYGAMPWDVTVVVLTEAPKALPPTVQQRVGLPSADPWSLPFAHKQLFADNLSSYDLFIYTEDDIDVTEQTISAFLDATEVLEPDEVAGFLRFERSEAGRWMPDAHGAYRWKPESVVTRGGRVFAEFSNEHAAFFVLTRSQLRRAIKSGGFMREPYQSRYDMLCTAATDPYTSCGLRKLICVSSLDQFLVHHMSDRYVDALGMPYQAFEQQAEVVVRIAGGQHPAVTLCPFESQLRNREWSANLDEPVNRDILAQIPDGVRTALSIGCGSGETEAALVRRGCQVTALPLDSIAGARLEPLGVDAIFTSLDRGLAQLRGATYDCVVISHILHLQDDPADLFKRCLGLVRRGGAVIVSSPNFTRAADVLHRRVTERDRYRTLGDFAASGLRLLSPTTLKRVADRCGCRSTRTIWCSHKMPGPLESRGVTIKAGRLTATNWVLRAIR